MAKDGFAGQDGGLIAPAHRWVAITPDDDNDLAEVPKALAIGATGGALVCRGADGVDATFYVDPGQVLPIRPHRVLDSGTDATPIIALY